jgi:hypothetical protein
MLLLPVVALSYRLNINLTASHRRNGKVTVRAAIGIFRQPNMRTLHITYFENLPRGVLVGCIEFFYIILYSNLVLS